jgi:hypothetical protein
MLSSMCRQANSFLAKVTARIFTGIMLIKLASRVESLNAGLGDSESVAIVVLNRENEIFIFIFVTHH